MIWEKTNRPELAIPKLNFFRQNVHLQLDIRHTRKTTHLPYSQPTANQLSLLNRTLVLRGYLQKSSARIMAATVGSWRT